MTVRIQEVYIMADRKENFFTRAFRDMKEDARAQHEVDKANFAAAKAESKANFEDAKAMHSAAKRKAAAAAEREEAIAAANARKAAAEERISAAHEQRN